MNGQFDIIIVGDSKSGNTIVKSLAAAAASIKIAFISREFKRTTTRDFINVEYVTGNVAFTDYKNRLFGCYLSTGERLYCTHLIVATGLRYEPLTVNSKTIIDVFNTADNIDKQAKIQQAIVVGGSDAAAKLALAAAKKYRYVYLCTKTMDICATDSTVKKLNDAHNIVVLPNSSITKVYMTKGVITSVELDSYSSLTCSAIFAKTPAVPDVDFVSAKLFAKDDEGFLKTTKYLESVLVPKCFAAGNCVKKSTKKMVLALIDNVLKDFIGGI